MLTPIKILVLIFLHFLGELPTIPMVRRVVLLLLLQQQQDDLDDDGPLTRSPYIDEGRRRRDQRVPRPAFAPPTIISMDSIVEFGERSSSHNELRCRFRIVLNLTRVSCCFHHGVPGR